MSLIDETILVKYILGEATPDESSQVNSWLNIQATNRKQLQQLIWILQLNEQLEPSKKVDEKAGWERLKQSMGNIPAKPAKILWQYWWMRVAAVLVLAAGLTAIYFIIPRRDKRQPSSTTWHMIHSGSQSRTDTLSDSSVVTLASYSSLQYPVIFIGNSRNVNLTGEAFFSVTHDPAKPFIVAVNDLSVTVVGTSFTIQSSDTATEIIVKTGRVQVKRKAQQLLLSAGESLKVAVTDSLLVKKKNHQPVATNVRVTTGSEDISNNTARQKAMMRSIIAGMITDHLVKNEKDIDWFALNENELTINGEKQSSIILKKYKRKYLLYSGYGFYYGPSKITGKGFFFSKQELKN